MWVSGQIVGNCGNTISMDGGGQSICSWVFIAMKCTPTVQQCLQLITKSHSWPLSYSQSAQFFSAHTGTKASALLLTKRGIWQSITLVLRRISTKHKWGKWGKGQARHMIHFCNKASHLIDYWAGKINFEEPNKSFPHHQWALAG